MHPEEHTRDGAGGALTLPMAHDCIQLEERGGISKAGGGAAVVGAAEGGRVVDGTAVRLRGDKGAG